MTVSDALRNVTRLGLDTPPVIYFAEEHPVYFPVCRAVFQAISSGEIHAATSAVTLTETLVKSIRLADAAAIAIYRQILGNPLLPLTDVTRLQADNAADLRARYNLKMADALQISCAMTAGCDAFLTGDKDLRRVAEIHVLVLDDLTT